MAIKVGGATLTRWTVLWLRDGEVYEKKFGTDIDAAIDAVIRLKSKGRKSVTLMCANVGFAVPPKYAKKMRGLNRKGIWWCPYCRKLRRFKGFKGESDRQVTYRCPMCDISSRDYHVIRNNQLAQTLEWRKTKRRGKGPRRTKTNTRSR